MNDTPLLVTPIYGALLVALYLVLTIRVIALRRARQISLGDGGDMALRARIRAQGNFIESAPLGLVMLMMAELAGAPVWALQSAGLALVLGRVLHGWSLGWRGPMAARVAGMALTFLALAICAIAAWLG